MPSVCGQASTSLAEARWRQRIVTEARSGGKPQVSFFLVACGCEISTDNALRRPFHSLPAPNQEYLTYVPTNVSSSLIPPHPRRPPPLSRAPTRRYSQRAKPHARAFIPEQVAAESSSPAPLGCGPRCHGRSRKGGGARPDGPVAAAPQSPPTTVSPAEPTPGGATASAPARLECCRVRPRRRCRCRRR